MKLIVGLGNPGARYERTCHNVGFRVVERLATGEWEARKRYRAWLSGPYFYLQSEERIRRRYLLVKPTTFMNRSGEAVGRLVREFKVRPEDLWVVHDDVDLPPSKIKIQKSGKESTHKGIASIVRFLGGGEFVRFRLGVGQPPPGVSREDYVLDEFKGEELESIERGIKKMTEAIKVALGEGIAAAMNHYHRSSGRFSVAP